MVQDQGHGLAPGEEELIFQKFYRGGGTGRDTGSGLGLPICAIVATLHGGRIEACNDGGARFEMRLPLPARPTGADWA